MLTDDRIAELYRQYHCGLRNPEPGVRDFARRIEEEVRAELAELIHYPQCWDTACYETLEDALIELIAEHLVTHPGLTAQLSEPLCWVYEDELPKSMTGEAYNTLFEHSKVDGVRLFPIFGPPIGHSADTPADGNAQVAVPEGWKLVPIEPTDTMRFKPVGTVWFHHHCSECGTNWQSSISANKSAEVYRVMINAAPAPAFKVNVDPSIPVGELHAVQDGKVVGRIVNIETPASEADSADKT